MKAYNIIEMEGVASTNDVAKKMLKTEHVPEFTVISAKKQFLGRGQRLNSWHSEAGLNLTFSIILYPTFLEAVQQFYLSKVISISILDYLNSKNKLYKIKWPNDIMFDHSKICGILIENSLSGMKIKDTVVGIGININQKEFPANLPYATSLALINNKEYVLETELKELLDHIILRFNKLLLEKKFIMIDSIYHKNLYKMNEKCAFKDSSGIFKGSIVGTEPDGHLIIQTDKELKKYKFKEIEFLTD